MKAGTGIQEVRKRGVEYGECESGSGIPGVEYGEWNTQGVGKRGVEYEECESGNLLRVLWSAAKAGEGILDEEPAQQILRLLTDRLGESNLHHKEKNSLKRDRLAKLRIWIRSYCGCNNPRLESGSRTKSTTSFKNIVHCT